MLIKDIDNKIGSLKKEYKTELEISKFLIMRAEVQLEKIKQATINDEYEDDEKFKQDILALNKTLKDSLKTSSEARQKIQIGLALLEKNKLSVSASEKRAENIFTISNTEVTKKSRERITKIKNLVREKEISVSCAVYELIRKAMASYYFDKIGDCLLARTKNPDNFSLSDLKIFVHSYNEHVYIPVEITELI